jgi:hypothetical protein
MELDARHHHGELMPRDPLTQICYLPQIVFSLFQIDVNFIQTRHLYVFFYANFSLKLKIHAPFSEQRLARNQIYSKRSVEFVESYF